MKDSINSDELIPDKIQQSSTTLRIAIVPVITVDNIDVIPDETKSTINL